MGCVPAPACKAALAEATRQWPDRRRTSDGICPSAAHTKQNPTSDHEKGNAFDLSHDPDHGVDCHVLAGIVKNDPRIKYVIFNRRIWNPSVALRWRPYSGSNPHTIHMHVSIQASARNDTSPWFKVEPQEINKLMLELAFITVLIPHGATPPPPYGLIPFWGIGKDGGVFACNGAPFHGAATGMSIQPFVDAALTPSGNGYWLLAADGGIFTFGDATYNGSYPEAANKKSLESRYDFQAIKARNDGVAGYHLFVGSVDPGNSTSRVYTFPEELG